MEEKQYPEMDALRDDLKRGTVGNLYLFCGEEAYLEQFYLGQLRQKLVAPGTEEFNHRRLEGRGMTVRELEEALNAYPAFAERTLIEVRDWNVFALPEEERKKLLELLEDVPDYVCFVLIYDTEPYKPDKRLKHNAAILKCFRVVEFGLQPREKLLKWVMNRSAKLGAPMGRDAAEYLVFLGGGSMTRLDPEVQKLASYAEGEVTRADIDAVVTPVIEAVAWKLTEELTAGRYDSAMVILGKLIEMQEPVHKIIAAVSAELRRLLEVKLWLENGRPTGELKKLGLFRYDFQMQKTITAARRQSLRWCIRAVRACSECAYRLNSDRAEYEDSMRQLLCELAML